MKPPTLLDRISRLDAHHRILIATFATVVFFLLIRQYVIWPVQLLTTWVVYALLILLLTWITILSIHPKEIRKKAGLEDTSRVLIFLFVTAATLVSLLAVFVVLLHAKNETGVALTKSVILSGVSVVVSWFLLHTLFTLRYAHLYYSQETNKDEQAGGLDFPSEKEPDYLDFAYFSFVIGMTCQVSDVQITSRTMRRLALLHGLLAFVFNTAILALSINVFSGLLER